MKTQITIGCARFLSGVLTQALDEVEPEYKDFYADRLEELTEAIAEADQSMPQDWLKLRKTRGEQ
jgi:ABC-type Zn uptake system ZnuABC Zn-binding protein ZnuA